MVVNDDDDDDDNDNHGTTARSQQLQQPRRKRKRQPPPQRQADSEVGEGEEGDGQAPQQILLHYDERQDGRLHFDGHGGGGTSFSNAAAASPMHDSHPYSQQHDSHYPSTSLYADGPGAASQTFADADHGGGANGPNATFPSAALVQRYASRAMFPTREWGGSETQVPFAGATQSQRVASMAVAAAADDDEEEEELANEAGDEVGAEGDLGGASLLEGARGEQQQQQRRQPSQALPSQSQLPRHTHALSEAAASCAAAAIETLPAPSDHTQQPHRHPQPPASQRPYQSQQPHSQYQSQQRDRPSQRPSYYAQFESEPQPPMSEVFSDSCPPVPEELMVMIQPHKEGEDEEVKEDEGEEESAWMGGDVVTTGETVAAASAAAATPLATGDEWEEVAGESQIDYLTAITAAAGASTSSSSSSSYRRGAPAYTWSALSYGSDHSRPGVAAPPQQLGHLRHHHHDRDAGEARSSMPSAAAVSVASRGMEQSVTALVLPPALPAAAAEGKGAQVAADRRRQIQQEQQQQQQQGQLLQQRQQGQQLHQQHQRPNQHNDNDDVVNLTSQPLLLDPNHADSGQLLLGELVPSIGSSSTTVRAGSTSGASAHGGGVSRRGKMEYSSSFVREAGAVSARQVQDPQQKRRRGDGVEANTAASHYADEPPPPPPQQNRRPPPPSSRSDARPITSGGSRVEGGAGDKASGARARAAAALASADAYAAMLAGSTSTPAAAAAAHLPRGSGGDGRDAAATAASSSTLSGGGKTAAPSMRAQPPIADVFISRGEGAVPTSFRASNASSSSSTCNTAFRASNASSSSSTCNTAAHTITKAATSNHKGAAAVSTTEVRVNAGPLSAALDRSGGKGLPSPPVVTTADSTATTTMAPKAKQPRLPSAAASAPPSPPGSTLRPSASSSASSAYVGVGSPDKADARARAEQDFSQAEADLRDYRAAGGGRRASTASSTGGGSSTTTSTSTNSSKLGVAKTGTVVAAPKSSGSSGGDAWVTARPVPPVKPPHSSLPAAARLAASRAPTSSSASASLSSAGRGSSGGRSGPAAVSAVSSAAATASAAAPMASNGGNIGTGRGAGGSNQSGGGGGVKRSEGAGARAGSAGKGPPAPSSSSSAEGRQQYQPHMSQYFEYTSGYRR